MAMINIKLLFFLSFLIISVVYYLYIPIEQVILILKDEYILSFVSLLSLFIWIFLDYKLKYIDILNFVPNTTHINLKNSILLFLLFQLVDFYMEDGFIGMISQWYIYWLFGLLAYFLTNIINLYKNMQYYKD